MARFIRILSVLARQSHRIGVLAGRGQEAPAAWHGRPQRCLSARLGRDWRRSKIRPRLGVDI